MCDCDCELPKRERWAQVASEAAGKAAARIAELEKDSAFLAALEAAGVDNWDGYDEALRELEDEG